MLPVLRTFLVLLFTVSLASTSLGTTAVANFAADRKDVLPTHRSDASTRHFADNIPSFPSFETGLGDSNAMNVDLNLNDVDKKIHALTNAMMDAAHHHGRRTGVAGVCADSAATNVTVSTEQELKNAVACANSNTDKTYKVRVDQDITFTDTWRGYSYVRVENNARLEIEGVKAGGEPTELRGQGQAFGTNMIVWAMLGTHVTLRNLRLRNGYVSPCSTFASHAFICTERDVFSQ